MYLLSDYFAYRNQDDAISVWSMIVATIADPQEVKRLLFDISNLSPDRKSKNFHRAAKFSSPLFVEMLNWCTLNLNHEDLKKVFSELDNDEQSVMHLLAECGNKSSVGNFLKLVSKSFQQEELKEMFLAENKLNSWPQGLLIPLQSTFNNAEPEVVEMFWKAYCDVFDTEQLLNIISKENFIYKGNFRELYPLHRQEIYERTQKLFRDWKPNT